MSQPVTTDLSTAEVVSGGVPPLKPGYATTEFWVTLLTTVASLAVAMGWIGPNFVHDHDAVVNAVALIAATVSPAAYAIARGVTKGKHQTASAAVVAAQTPLPVLSPDPLP